VTCTPKSHRISQRWFFCGKPCATRVSDDQSGTLLQEAHKRHLASTFDGIWVRRRRRAPQIGASCAALSDVVRQRVSSITRRDLTGANGRHQQERERAALFFDLLAREDRQVGAEVSQLLAVEAVAMVPTRERPEIGLNFLCLPVTTKGATLRHENRIGRSQEPDQLGKAWPEFRGRRTGVFRAVRHLRG